MKNKDLRVLLLADFSITGSAEYCIGLGKQAVGFGSFTGFSHYLGSTIQVLALDLAEAMTGNYGRDADTIGAVCGAILGAKYTLASIPPRWVEKVRHPSGTCLTFTKGLDILDVADQLATLI